MPSAIMELRTTILQQTLVDKTRLSVHAAIIAGIPLWVIMFESKHGRLFMPHCFPPQPLGKDLENIISINE
jgi:hypothetical protein